MCYGYDKKRRCAFAYLRREGDHEVVEGECEHNGTSACHIKTQAPSVSRSLDSSLSEGAYVCNRLLIVRSRALWLCRMFAPTICLALWERWHAERDGEGLRAPSQSLTRQLSLRESLMFAIAF